MDDVHDVLQKADRHLTMIGALYEADLELQRQSPTLRGKVRTFLDTEKSALDFVAGRVVAAAGVTDADAHYPLAPEASSFDAFLDKFMPGVRETLPDVAAAVSAHQPYAVPALAQLRALLIDETRQGLIPRTRPAPAEAAPQPSEEEANGAVPAPAPLPPPPSGMGGGLTGAVFINGVAHDPITMQPLNPTPAVRRDTIYEDWLFVFDDIEVSALRTLEAIHAAVTSAVEEVSAVPGSS